MAISHELSGEIAAALFAAKERSPHELDGLKEIVFEIHSTLEQLNGEESKARAARMDHASESDRGSGLKAQLAARSKSAGNDF